MARYKSVLFITPCVSEIIDTEQYNFLTNLTNNEILSIGDGKIKLQYENTNESYADAMDDLKNKLLEISKILEGKVNDNQKSTETPK
jgi:hypothetical protein